MDAFNFLRDYSSRDSIQSRGESLGEQDQRTVVDLLTDEEMAQGPKTWTAWPNPFPDWP